MFFYLIQRTRHLLWVIFDFLSWETALEPYSVSLLGARAMVGALALFSTGVHRDCLSHWMRFRPSLTGASRTEQNYHTAQGIRFGQYSFRVYEGRTLGTPIAMLIPNSDHRPEAYTEMKEKYRPSHADFTYQTKFGRRNHEGGGRSSARETAGRVAAGAIARKILQQGAGIEIRAYVSQVHDIEMSSVEALPSLAEVDKSCTLPDADTAAQMEKRILEARKAGDSVGGVILCRVQNLPVGLGAPVFDRLEADLAKAMLSLPATKGFEVGSGFQEHVLKVVSTMTFLRSVRVTSEAVTNRSGGVQGGISNGEELYFRTAFKPTATVLQEQQTVDLEAARRS